MICLVLFDFEIVGMDGLEVNFCVCLFNNFFLCCSFFRFGSYGVRRCIFEEVVV